MNDLPIGENWPPSLGVDSVQALFDGQTFNSIAENVYCDGSFGDLVGFQSGYKADESIPSEMRVKLLILQATINRNWQGDYMPYDADRIIGPLYPKIPIPAIKDTHKEWVDVLAFTFAIAAGILVPELMGFMFAGMTTGGAAAVASAGIATTTAEDIAVGVTTAAVADVGDQEIEISFGNQQKFNMHELDLALVGGAVGGLAAGLNGVSLLKATPFQASWKSIELDTRISLVKTMLNEAIHHGKVDWRGFVTDVIDSAIAAETTHALPGGGEGGLLARDMADSLADDLMKDAVYHRTPDWQNVAVDAAGTAIGTVVGDQMSAAIDEQRQKAAEHALQASALLAKANTIAANSAALGQTLNDPFDLDTANDGYDFDMGGFADPTMGTTPANDDGYASDHDLAGHTGDAYGTTTHQPRAETAPITAAQANRDKTNSTIAMQNALDKRISNGAEHIFAGSASQASAQPGELSRLKTDFEVAKVVVGATLFPNPYHGVGRKLAPYASDLYQGIDNVNRAAGLLASDGSDPDLFPELAKSNSSMFQTEPGFNWNGVMSHNSSAMYRTAEPDGLSSGEEGLQNDVNKAWEKLRRGQSDISAKNPASADVLNRKLRALQKAQMAAEKIVTTSDGKIKYYSPEEPSRDPGPTRGAAFVTQYDPTTGEVSTMFESFDQDGNIVRVHPKALNGEVFDVPHIPPTGNELLSGVGDFFENNYAPFGGK